MMKNINTKALLILMLTTLLFSGCATLSSEQCAKVDWSRIGRIDGENGKSSETYRTHARTCEKETNQADKETYLQSWHEGLKTYCTAENGYKVGVAGAFSGTVCDRVKYPEFAEQFNLGRSVYELQSERKEIRAQIDERNSDETVVAQIHRGYSLLNGKDPNKELTDKDRELKDKIRFLESNAPVNMRGRSELENALTVTDSFVNRDTLGALTGTVFGFGLGHAVQRRYLKDGWKWTAGEVAAFTLIFATSKEENCKDSGRPQSPTNTEDRCAQTNGWASLTWLAFRVWQSYDLWSFSSKTNSIYANSVIIPRPDGLTYSYSF